TLRPGWCSVPCELGNGDRGRNKHHGADGASPRTDIDPTRAQIRTARHLGNDRREGIQEYLLDINHRSCNHLPAHEQQADPDWSLGFRLGIVWRLQPVARRSDTLGDDALASENQETDGLHRSSCYLHDSDDTRSVG